MQPEIVQVDGNCKYHKMEYLFSMHEVTWLVKDWPIQASFCSHYPYVVPHE